MLSTRTMSSRRRCTFIILSGAKVLERVFVTQLIVTDSAETGKRVIGVSGFNVITGDPYLILANATILATGEAIRLFSNNQSSNAWSTWHSPYNNGTAQALAFVGILDNWKSG